MKTGKLLTVMITMAAALVLFACGTEEPPLPTEPTGTARVKVGMAKDEWELSDRILEESAQEGLDRVLSDFEVSTQFLVSKSSDQYENNLDALAKENDLVICAGLKMAPMALRLALKYPDRKFLLIDGKVEAPNVRAVEFREHEGAYLLGMIAGSMTKTGKVGFIGGMELPVTRRYQAGFMAGVMSVNEVAYNLLAGGTMIKYSGSYTDTTKVRDLANDLYSQGADIIVNAAGSAGEGLYEAAEAAGLMALGTERDEAFAYPERAKVILASVVKDAGKYSYAAVKDILEGGFTGGVVSSGISEGGIALSANLHPDLAADRELLSLVKSASDRIEDGTITVPDDPAELKEIIIQQGPGN